MIKRTLYIILSVIGAILIAIALFAVMMSIFGWFIGSMPDPRGEEAYFGYFYNSVGLAVAATGTIIAIILAYNALKTSEIQTTTVALQEFRGEIDDFVNEANRMYSTLIALLLLGARMHRSSRAVNSALRSVEYEIDGAEDDLRDLLTTFTEQQKEFRLNIKSLHESMMGGGNIFLRKMVQHNLLSCRDDIEELRRRLTSHKTPYLSSPLDDSESLSADLSIIDTLSYISSLKCVGAFAVSDGEHDDDEFLSYQEVQQFSDHLIYGSSESRSSLKEFIDSISMSLPAIPSMDDHDIGPITVQDDELGEVLTNRYQVMYDKFPDEESILYFSAHGDNNLYAFKHILSIYLKLINPESGVKAMRNHFATFGARPDILRLFIDSHSARLSYSFRRESKLLFNLR